MTSPGSVRTFRAPDARTALAAVKEALGADAVIVSTRQVPGGLFRKAMVEVTAAPGPGSSAAERSSGSPSRPVSPAVGTVRPAGLPAAYAARLSPAPVPQVAPPPTATARMPLVPGPASEPATPLTRLPRNDSKAALSQEIFGTSALGSATTARPFLTSPPTPFPPPIPPAAVTPSAPPERRLSSPPMPVAEERNSFVTRPVGVAEPTAPILRADDLREEVGRDGSSQKRGRHWRRGGAADNLRLRYEEKGVEGPLCESLIADGITAGLHEEHDLDLFVRGQLSSLVRTCPAPWERGAQRTVFSLVGPTGVGKTTTLAKIAARAILSSRLKVALITTDTYRICASDQLARYGQIMRSPTFVARDASQLATALDQTREFDLVLVDTAGRAIQGDLEQQINMLRDAGILQMYLTLSLASGARELAANCRRYGALKPARIILTKVDESVAPGAALGPLADLGLPVTCVTHGQEVPEDVRPVDGRELLDLMLGPVVAGSSVLSTGRGG